MSQTTSTNQSKLNMTSQTSSRGMVCRGCGCFVEDLVVDLGLSPLCENLIQREQTNSPEMFYPLRVYVCNQCWLVQLDEYVSGIEIFDETYAYYSSVSSSWLEHCRKYCESVINRLSLTKNSKVIEVACNDGYLLKNFVDKEIPCLGIEPATEVASEAEAIGIDVCKQYFGTALAKELIGKGEEADLMIGNNVLAHVPDLHDFLGGFKVLLKQEGTITFEFPHLLELIKNNQFDTIYQEHYCYFSMIALTAIFQQHELRIYDVEKLKTHGGSLRIYACHQESNHPTVPSVSAILQEELAMGLNKNQPYREFAERVSETKWKLLEFLIDANRNGKKVVGYGAPGKGNTLLNYCGIREDLIKFTVDKNKRKQNTLLVGSRIPVHAPEAIKQEKPDYIVILPWNIKEEIISEIEYARDWGAKFIIPIPTLEIIS